MTIEQQILILKGLQTQHDANEEMINKSTKDLLELKTEWSKGRTVSYINELEKENKQIEILYKTLAK